MDYVQSKLSHAATRRAQTPHARRRGVVAIASLRTYYSLTKPGIIRGNLLTTATGFLLASKLHPHWPLLAATLGGTALVIASACVCNNYLDRGIDAKMERTKKRALVNSEVTSRQALTYAAVLGILGIVLLAYFTNYLTVTLGLIGFFGYVIAYGYWKRRSVYGTHVGCIPGAVPPVAGYCAVTNHLDTAAIILFFTLIFWQLAHFFAIAIYRRDDYAKARIPVIAVQKGMRNTKYQILFYIAAFTASATMLTIYDYAGYIYAVAATALGLAWLVLGLRMGLRNLTAVDDRNWGRAMFLASLGVITVLCIAIPLGPILA